MRKGFTLIELLVVMVIIGILIGMAVPNYIKVKERAKETQVQAGLHIIRVALERYAVDWDGLYPVVLTGGDQLYNFATTDG
ncbi:MAG: type II secretion system protein, partial [bacterium JZ-2024 1]